ncbi:hypothetical protein KMW28_25020 [Flammeovirga yaeyamensis]|uniref:Membrane or secreted protein n=1 Tax=Flammeovirga yaeyamensis TaxID=367791 RepID=A0AAX1N9I3_9BACT|nr:hypothetical protein [Flammeovirga yaeyamensis]MBB3699447.1 hypothetical protein [Flammeovirga yaeyamensis]NMF35296.1 hypothetical protein [Flammeovirga yaeyamensis]QWG04156.1 hypothetical protein KMW28_25020 [Flammeovirga yaeyamensis]
MNIEKIKNFNQILLSVVGVILICFLLLGFFSAAFILTNEVFKSKKDNGSTGILAEEKVEELQSENKRKQLVAYEYPRLADILNQVYIIPITHINLKKAENIAEYEFEERDAYERFEFSDSKSYKSYRERYYHNLIVFDNKTLTSKKLFNGRLNFNRIDVDYFKADGDIIVNFKAATKDTNKDGVIDQLDLKSIYLYSITNDKLNEITLPNADVKNYNFIEGEKDLIINFGIDANKSGIYDSRQEPNVIKKYIYKTGELVDVIQPKMMKELQQQLEGSSK